MRQCPECGLINPDVQQTCDCGIAFRSDAVYDRSPGVPTGLFLYLAIVFGAAFLTLALPFISPGPPTSNSRVARLGLQVEWAARLVWATGATSLAFHVLNRKNWARIALALWTLPLGVVLLILPAARKYTNAPRD